MFSTQSRLKNFGALASTLFMAVSLGSQQALAQTVPDSTSFELYPNAKFIPCMAADPNVTPRVYVTVKRGDRNDLLRIGLQGFKPGIQFDMFTIERSNQDDNGNPVTIPSFGLAWYQSDLEPGVTSVKTILLDQIFGFDPDKNLPPTKTLNVGFWFNNPNDAVACGFDPSKPTPFNGENMAGPLAFISRPNATTGLGPLCLKPNTSTVPATCDP